MGEELGLGEEKEERERRGVAETGRKSLRARGGWRGRKREDLREREKLR